MSGSHNDKSQKRTEYPQYALYAVLLVLIVLFIYLWGIFVSFRNETLVWSHIDAYRQEKRDFCYDRSIVPCDTTKIGAWNDQHPSDRFTFKTDQQLANEIPLNNY